MKPLNQNLVAITEILSDGQYHDGTSIGKRLNITRAAVWKLIKKLEQYAVPLTSVKGKGYRLESPCILLTPDKIKAKLRHRLSRLDIVEKIDSTNDYLKPFAAQNQSIITCIAETQTQGKGRLHRQWHSPFAENIYLSMCCPFEKDIGELSGLSLVVSLAICDAIESAINLKAQTLKVKWPNDVLIDYHKLAGVLIEIQAESNGFCQVIIGAGINVNMNKVLAQNIGQAWSSLAKITGNYIDRNHLSAAIIDTLIDYLERFSSKGLAYFTSAWQKRDCLAKRAISVLSGNKKIAGTCIGINEQGQLLLKTKQNKVLSLSSGDTTLLK
ncbi:MAG: biotin--[acetyl-CoA-carboxylase] ligase [Pseudomonadota bacterium]